MKIKKDFIPLGISIILVLVSLFLDTITNIKFYLGIAGVIISTALYFKNRSFYRYLFLVILLLATFNLVYISSFNLIFLILNFEINLIEFSLLILFLYFNRDYIESKLRNEISDDELKQRSKMRVERFKNKFEEFSDYEIIQHSKRDLVPEALEALKKIRESRGI